jgi:hypothetical protein
MLSTLSHFPINRFSFMYFLQTSVEYTPRRNFIIWLNRIPEGLRERTKKLNYKIRLCCYLLNNNSQSVVTQSLQFGCLHHILNPPNSDLKLANCIAWVKTNPAIVIITCRGNRWNLPTKGHNSAICISHKRLNPSNREEPNKGNKHPLKSYKSTNGKPMEKCMNDMQNYGSRLRRCQSETIESLLFLWKVLL